ncbi:MAG TPA: tetratricopeptide repeat protein [Candidatus Competibacteraceae bacterium]|nr:tetratricopeptide repeat protein [Candidatus Competibacteraceae bacterium]
MKRMRYLAPCLGLLVLSGCTNLQSPLAALQPRPSLNRSFESAGIQQDREQYYLELTRLQPQAAEPWFQLGNIYVEQNRLEEAEQAFREALHRDDRPQALHNLGLVQVRLGLQAITQARERLPADDPVHEDTRALLQTLLQSAM